jgi:hypothetical protein
MIIISFSPIPFANEAMSASLFPPLKLIKPQSISWSQTMWLIDSFPWAWMNVELLPTI